jgi:DNA (cytosine-5)-methyltransferase 1
MTVGKGLKITHHNNNYSNMTHASLFSGIGGFDLAAQWMGWENVFNCEIDPFPRKIINYYWPNAISYEDITKTDFTIHRGTIDVLTGGYPCQPYSLAGKRKGSADSRHLWPEMLRAIKEIQPHFVVGENVPGIINWDGGMVFEQVCTDMEGEGYEVWPIIIPACAVNAPHRRDRVWFVAYSNGHGNTSFRESGKVKGKGCDRIKAKEEGGSGSKRANGFPGVQRDGAPWQNFPAQPPACNGNDGLSARLDQITFPKWQAGSIKAGGNAIIPQIAYEIFCKLRK